MFDDRGHHGRHLVEKPATERRALVIGLTDKALQAAPHQVAHHRRLGQQDVDGPIGLHCPCTGKKCLQHRSHVVFGNAFQDAGRVQAWYTGIADEPASQTEPGHLKDQATGPKSVDDHRRLGWRRP